MMKKILCRKTLRLVSIAVAIVAITVDCLSGRMSLVRASIAVSGAMAVLFVNSAQTEKTRIPLILSVLYAVSFSTMFCIDMNILAVQSLPPLFAFAVCVCNGLPELMGRGLGLSNKNIVAVLNAYVNALASAGYYCISIVLSIWPGCAVFCLIAYSVLYVLLYVKAYLGKTILLFPKCEERIKAVSMSKLRPYDMDAYPDELRAFYERLVKRMTEQKLFLEDSLSINSIASKMCTNRSYVSKSINICFGNNFSQFVNSFRVRYAIELLEKDPRIKIWELAQMCGYRNQVTFTAAFKYFTNMTPAEYTRQSRHVNIQLLSRTSAKEPLCQPGSLSPGE